MDGSQGEILSGNHRYFPKKKRGFPVNCPLTKPIVFYNVYHLVMTNITMENGPFIVDFPIKTSIYEGFSMPNC